MAARRPLLPPAPPPQAADRASGSCAEGAIYVGTAGKAAQSNLTTECSPAEFSLTPSGCAPVCVKYTELFCCLVPPPTPQSAALPLRFALELLAVLKLCKYSTASDFVGCLYSWGWEQDAQYQVTAAIVGHPLDLCLVLTYNYDIAPLYHPSSRVTLRPLSRAARLSAHRLRHASF